MSRRLPRRTFLGKTIATALGAGAAFLLDGPTAPSAVGPSPVPRPPRELNGDCAAVPEGPELWRVEAPPAGTLYHGVYPGHCADLARCDAPGEGSGEEDTVAPEDLLSYASAVGEDVPVAWVYFSHEWGNGEAFPAATARWIRERRCVPFVRLMLRKDSETEGCEKSKAHEDRYTLEKINAGCFDEKLRAWGREARGFASPLIVEWGTEVNGCWFHWNGRWHGREAGASLFRNAFRRIVRLVRDEGGAQNVTWVFHATAAGDPGDEWNGICRYYPGDDFVDWIGLSAYGADYPLAGAPCVPFDRRIGDAMRELGALKTRKPLFVLEFGAPGNHPGCDPAAEGCAPAQCDVAAWADNALGHLVDNTWPEVRGFSWWNEVWEDTARVDDKDVDVVMNMRVQSFRGLAEKFRSRLHERPGRLACPVYRRAEPRPPQLKLLVPAYFSPGGTGARDWDALVEAAADVDLVVIANPASGPGKKRDDAYRRYIERLAAHGATVVGYVSTGYGKVPLKKIQGDVRKWLDWYAPLGGFFFDEQASGASGEGGVDLVSHYRAVFDYARREAGKKSCGAALVVSNPGTDCSERYLTEAGADVLCLYERPEGAAGGATFRDFTPPEWMKRHPPRRFASLMLRVGSAETMAEYLRKAAADGFGHAYVTDRPAADPSGGRCAECLTAGVVTPACEEDCNPWNRLAAYWRQEVRDVQGGAQAPACG